MLINADAVMHKCRRIYICIMTGSLPKMTSLKYGSLYIRRFV